MNPGGERARTKQIASRPIRSLRLEPVIVGTLSVGLVSWLGWFLLRPDAPPAVWWTVGVGLAVVLVSGNAALPGVLLGAFLGPFVQGQGLGPSLLVAAVQICAVVAGTALVRVTPWWSDLRQLAWPVRILPVALVSGSIGGAAMAVGTRVANGSAHELVFRWLAWGTATGLGVLCCVPVAIVFARRQRALPGQPMHSVAPGSRGDLPLVIALAVVAGLATFGVSNGPYLLFLLGLPSLWISVVRLGTRGAAISGLILTAIGSGFSLVERSFGGSGASVGQTQVVIALLGMAALLLPAIAHPRIRSMSSAVLLLGWGLGALLLHGLVSDRERHAAVAFDEVASDAEQLAADQLASYADALRQGARLFAASDHVSRREWTVFSSMLRLTDRFPGIRGVGAALPVADADLSDFSAAARADGCPSFGVHDVFGLGVSDLGVSDLDVSDLDVSDLDASDADERSVRYVSLYIEPLDRNRAFLGLDLASERNCRDAAEEARD
ncbi:MAG: CHASE domain-containing protein, partial [Candidatus Eisenbacteria bacterium]|nr:CHASE domain-containing protein [Candidatus Eisenbacteria bacterium]